MKGLERTRQQLDPVGSLASRVLTITLSSGAFIYGTILTMRTVEQISHPLLAVVAIVLLASAALTASIASSPRRAPFTAKAHLLVHLFALGAMVFSAASQWGSNTHVQDDFGPVSLGILLVAIGGYRPGRELASFGALSAVFIGFITLLQVPGLVTNAPPASVVLVGIAPVVALSFGAAAYSSRLVVELEKWQQLSSRTMAAATRRLTGGIEESVRQDRIRILDREVFPFLNEILHHDLVTVNDRLKARSIAASIRTLMVAEADQTWLEVAASDHGIAAADIYDSVSDSGGHANRMTTGQRTALRAFLVALREHASFVRQILTVSITGSDKKSRCILSAEIGYGADDPREYFDPYFAVLRIVFSELKVEYVGHKLTVRFAYEQR